MKKKLPQIIEALLFASDSPLTVAKIKTIIGNTNTKDIKDAINELNKIYEKSKSALSVIEVANGFQMVTREEYANYVQELFKGRSASRLTARAMETLAIIAYEQPITKQRMEHIRGVNVDGVVKTLLERNLISILGREKAPGNPLLYGTTNYFLEYFGLKSLDDLPKLKEIDELLKGDEDFLKSLDQVALQQIEPEALGIKNVNTEDQNILDLGSAKAEKTDNNGSDADATKTE